MPTNLDFLKGLIRPWLPKVKNLKISIEPKDAIVKYSFEDNTGEQSGEKKGQDIADEFLKWFQ